MSRLRILTVLLALVWLTGCVGAGVLTRGGHFAVTHLHFGLFNAGIFGTFILYLALALGVLGFLIKIAISYLLWCVGFVR